MADDKLTEADLRDAKDEVLGRMSEQSKQWGTLPDMRKAEDFVDPILHKVARDHELERQRAIVTAAVQGMTGDFADGGDGALMPTGRTRGRKAPPAGAGAIGDGQLQRVAVDPTQGLLAKQSAQDQLVSWCFQELLSRNEQTGEFYFPEWADEVLMLWQLCKKHDGGIIPADPHCFECRRRDDGLKAIVERAIRHFSHPLTPANRPTYSLPPKRNPSTRVTGS